MQNSWIHLSKGNASRQARVNVRQMNEEHVSRQGFFGPVSMLYHERPTGDPVRIEGSMSVGAASLAGFRPDAESGADDAVVKALFNHEMAIYIARREEAMPYLLRNIDADMLYFVHEGTGVIATEFGPLLYEPGDFLLLPKGVTFRVLPNDPLLAMIVESKAPIALSEHRQVGRHSPIDPTVLSIPEPSTYSDWEPQEEWALRLKHGDDYSTAYYSYLPFDVTGWKGDLFPFKLNVRDIRSITSERFHLAPSSWAIFESASFIAIGFLPMSIVTDPEAEELPSRHRNLDTEEAVLLRSANGIPMNVLLHMPQGITHGPSGDFRDEYEAHRQPGMARMNDGISIDAYTRLERTPAYLEAVKEARQIKRQLPLPTTPSKDLEVCA